MIMQTDHETASHSEKSPTKRRSFRTREEELFDADLTAWVREHLEWPILGAVLGEARSAPRTNRARRVFLEHYFAFFREADLMELPTEGKFLTEWLALAFESAYDFARQNREQAEAWLDEFRSDRHLAEARLQVFKSESCNPSRRAHDFVLCAVQTGHSGGQPVKENTASVATLIDGVESFFWTGLFAAIEGRHDPEASELMECFDKASAERWNDRRYHMQLIRKAPQSGRHWSSAFLKHPLLRVAEEKYRRSPHERAAIGSLLETLCLRSGVQSERHVIWRDLDLARWVRDAARWGAWMVRERAGTVQQILATTNAFTGDHLSRFYRRVLDGVDDINDFVEVTLALLFWQSRERGEATTRYYGERLETVVNCVDAAAWLPWWLAEQNGELSLR
jgi:hypothetical protein